MKAAKIKRLIKKLNVSPSARMRHRTLGDALEAQAESRKTKSAEIHQGLSSTIMRSRVTRLAAAAVIIVAIGFVVHRISREHTDGQITSEPAKSPSEMLTFMSLTMAYRQGGIEAVEKQCEQAVELLGPRTKNLSVRELFEEFNSNGDNPERTEL